MVRGFDLRGSGPAADAAVDVEAGLLVLQAARHYDRLGGHRFARLEEKGAQSVLAAAGAASGGSDGLPGALLQRRSGQAFVAGTPSAHSGLVTALGVVVLSQVLADMEASPRPSS